jgi:hypothetical protein
LFDFADEIAFSSNEERMLMYTVHFEWLPEDAGSLQFTDEQLSQ